MTRPATDDRHASGMSLKEVADALGISPQRVQQIERTALNKLRRYAQMRAGSELRQYFEDLEA